MWRFMFMIEMVSSSVPYDDDNTWCCSVAQWINNL